MRLLRYSSPGITHLSRQCLGDNFNANKTFLRFLHSHKFSRPNHLTELQFGYDVRGGPFQGVLTIASFISYHNDRLHESLPFKKYSSVSHSDGKITDVANQRTPTIGVGSEAPGRKRSDIIAITSTNNEVVKHLALLRTSSKHRKLTGTFVMTGADILREAALLKSRLAPLRFSRQGPLSQGQLANASHGGGSTVETQEVDTESTTSSRNQHDDRLPATLQNPPPPHLPPNLFLVKRLFLLAKKSNRRRTPASVLPSSSPPWASSSSSLSDGSSSSSSPSFPSPVPHRDLLMESESSRVSSAFKRLLWPPRATTATKETSHSASTMMRIVGTSSPATRDMPTNYSDPCESTEAAETAALLAASGLRASQVFIVSEAVMAKVAGVETADQLFACAEVPIPPPLDLDSFTRTQFYPRRRSPGTDEESDDVSSPPPPPPLKAFRGQEPLQEEKEREENRSLPNLTVRQPPDSLKQTTRSDPDPKNVTAPAVSTGNSKGDLDRSGWDPLPSAGSSSEAARATLAPLPSGCLTHLLVLDSIRDPGNMGTLFRSALAMGWCGVFLLPGCCDPANDKAVRASCSAVLHMPYAKGSLDDLRKLAAAQKLEMICADMPDEITEEIGDDRPMDHRDVSDNGDVRGSGGSQALRDGERNSAASTKSFISGSSRAEGNGFGSGSRYENRERRVHRRVAGENELGNEEEEEITKENQTDERAWRLGREGHSCAFPTVQSLFSTPHREFDPSPPEDDFSGVALVLGNEAHGLSRDVKHSCHRVVSVPMAMSSALPFSPASSPASPSSSSPFTGAFPEPFPTPGFATSADSSDASGFSEASQRCKLRAMESLNVATAGAILMFALKPDLVQKMQPVFEIGSRLLKKRGEAIESSGDKEKPRR